MGLSRIVNDIVARMRVGHLKVVTVIKPLPSGTNLVLHGSLRDNLVLPCQAASAEAELIASVWGSRLALSLYGQLNETMLSKPVYITYCYNAVVVQLTQQLQQARLEPDICLCAHRGFALSRVNLDLLSSIA